MGERRREKGKAGVMRWGRRWVIRNVQGWAKWMRMIGS